MKKVIGIDLNEIVRSFISTVHYFYEDEMEIKEHDVEYTVFDYAKLFPFEDKTVTSMLVDVPLDVAYTNNPKIVEEKEFISGERAMKIFMYEDYLFELFGSAPKSYGKVELELREMVHSNPDVEFKILVKEKTMAIPPSLFFISSMRLGIREFLFVEKDSDIWDKCDVYITANPDIINAKPEGKEVIVKNMPYNLEVEAENRFDYIRDIIEKDYIKNILTDK